VDVWYGLARVGAGIEDPAVAGLADAFIRGDPVRPVDHLAEQRAVRGGERSEVGMVLLRYDEHMYRGLRVDIAEGQDPVRFQHRAGGDFPGHDAAEQAFSHAKILGRLSDRRSSSGLAETVVAGAAWDRQIYGWYQR
jgi:hypothetical protein